MHGLMIFIIVFFSIILVTLLFFLTFYLGRRTVKNNPNKAIIMIKNGVEIIKYNATIAGKPSKNGTRYNYNNKTVFVPNNYQEIYYYNKRLIFLSRIGQLISSPFDIKEKLIDVEREQLIYELVESKIGSDAIKELKGSTPKINIIIIAIIAFIIGVMAVFGYNFVRNSMTPQTPQTPQTEQTEQQLPPIGVKE